MKKSTNDINANGVNGTSAASCSGSVAPGQLPIVQVGAVRDSATEPGRGGDQASPELVGQETMTGKKGLSGDQAGPPKVTGNNQMETDSNNNHEEWNQVKRKRKNRPGKTYRDLKKLQEFDSLFKNNEPYYCRFFDIKFPGCNILEDISPIKLDREIKNKLGNAVVKKSGRSGLFIEVKNQEQSNNIEKIKKIADQPVIIYKHKRFNQVKGVVRCKCLKHDTEDEIKEHLKSQDVADVRRVSIKRNNEIIKTDTYILTFNLLSCPKTIRIADWLIIRVDEYNYTPMQCYNCLKYGHISKFCRNEDKTCFNCSNKGHTKEECTSTPLCLHCKGGHLSNSKSCPRYQCETKIVNIQMKEKLPKPDAIEKFLETSPQYEELFYPPPIEIDSQEPIENIVQTNDPQLQPPNRNYKMENRTKTTNPNQLENSVNTHESSNVITESTPNPKIDKFNRKPLTTNILNKRTEQNLQRTPQKKTIVKSQNIPSTSKSNFIKDPKRSMKTTNVVSYDMSEDDFSDESSHKNDPRKRRLSPTYKDIASKKTNSRKSTENLQKIPTVGYSSSKTDKKLNRSQ